MAYKNTRKQGASRVCWEKLEARVRSQLQEWIQSLKEEEEKVTELRGRSWYERRQRIDMPKDYRNRYHDPRYLSLSWETVSVRKRRVRGSVDGFLRRILLRLPAREMKWENCSPSSISMASPMGISSCPCGDCWQGKHPPGQHRGPPEAEVATPA